MIPHPGWDTTHVSSYGGISPFGTRLHNIVNPHISMNCVALPRVLSRRTCHSAQAKSTILSHHTRQCVDGDPYWPRPIWARQAITKRGRSTVLASLTSCHTPATISRITATRLRFQYTNLAVWGLTEDMTMVKAENADVTTSPIKQLTMTRLRFKYTILAVWSITGDMAIVKAENGNVQCHRINNWKQKLSRRKM